VSVKSNFFQKIN